MNWNLPSRGGEPMPLAFPKHTPSVLVKREAKKAKHAEEARVRLLVKKRDRGLCRVCLTMLGLVSVPSPALYSGPHAAHRGNQMHHILPRSLGGKDTTKNCIWICAAHHQERHGGVIRISGDGDTDIHVERIWPIGGDA